MERQGSSVFISYRREETAPQAGRLYDSLAHRFGENHVFMDIDSIGLGLDFMKVIDEAVSSCEVLLAVIGSEWVRLTDARGARRLDDPQDFNRLEIETALARDIRVVPILVNGAPLPGPDELPETLAPLTRRQALPLTDTTFRADAARLLTQLEPVLGTTPAPKPESAEAGPSTAWRAELLERSDKLRRFRLVLTQETHTLDLRVGDFVDRVVLDGKVVGRRLGGFQGDYQFKMSDGRNTVEGLCRINMTWSASAFKEIVLKVGDAVLYAE